MIKTSRCRCQTPEENCWGGGGQKIQKLGQVWNIVIEWGMEGNVRHSMEKT
jgi:hypothetical protein